MKIEAKIGPAQGEQGFEQLLTSDQAFDLVSGPT